MVMTDLTGNFTCSICGRLTPSDGGYFNLPAGALCIPCGDREQVPERNLRVSGRGVNGLALR